jgi:adenylylsulfate kinase-like enzyme
MTRGIWLTGMSGVGKTTLGEALCLALPRGLLVDGDMMRRHIDMGPNPYSKEARDANVLRAAAEARALLAAGRVPVVALISPYAATRKQALELVGAGTLLVYLHCPIEVLRQRDPKGLYAKQAAGLISNLTGVDDPYEPPRVALELDTSQLTLDECVRRVLARYGATLDLEAG